MFPEWLPISTAPKDGTRILIFEPVPGTVRVSCWRNDTIPKGWTGSEHPPSHWLPLPLAPNQNSADLQQTQTTRSSHEWIHGPAREAEWPIEGLVLPAWAWRVHSIPLAHKVP